MSVITSIATYNDIFISKPSYSLAYIVIIFASRCYY